LWGFNRIHSTLLSRTRISDISSSGDNFSPARFGSFLTPETRRP
jgi:hypothetical protein